MAETGIKRLQTLLTTKPWLITLMLAGVLVLVTGMAAVGVGLRQNNEPQLEIIEASAAPLTAQKLLVDVGGAVENPGIYQLISDSRVNDALVVAGGLSLEADRDWVSQNLNLAGKLTDGQKIYVPFKDGIYKDSPRSDLQGLSLQDQININTASLAELDTLWGVGPVTAQKIIDRRPYAKIEDLLDKKIVKSNVYEAIKNQITVL